MLYLLLKAAISGVLIALASETARHNASAGALVASLPLVSVLGMIWLWHDTRDPARLADHAQATLWYVLPSLPMFLLIPVLLRAGAFFRDGDPVNPVPEGQTGVAPAAATAP